MCRSIARLWSWKGLHEVVKRYALPKGGPLVVGNPVISAEPEYKFLHHCKKAVPLLLTPPPYYLGRERGALCSRIPVMRFTENENTDTTQPF